MDIVINVKHYIQCYIVIIDIHTIVSLHIVSRIYGSYTRSYILMRKQCLVFMLAASTADNFATS